MRSQQLCLAEAGPEFSMTMTTAITTVPSFYAPRALHARSHLIVTHPDQAGTIVIPSLQVKKLRLGVVEGTWSRSHSGSQHLNTPCLTPALQARSAPSSCGDGPLWEVAFQGVG